VNGLGIISKSDIRFHSGGDEDINQRMIINSAGLVGIGTATPGSLLTLNKNGSGAQTLALMLQSNNTNVASIGWTAAWI
jgi:hypothetical protein